MRVVWSLLSRVGGGGGGGEKYLNRNGIIYYYHYYYCCYFLHPCPKTTPGAALGVKCVLYKQDLRRLDSDDHDDNRSAAKTTKRISPCVPAVAKNPMVVKKTASPGGRRSFYRENHGIRVFRHNK